jgi:hypothetical protein
VLLDLKLSPFCRFVLLRGVEQRLGDCQVPILRYPYAANSEEQTKLANIGLVAILEGLQGEALKVVFVGLPQVVIFEVIDFILEGLELHKLINFLLVGLIRLCINSSTPSLLSCFDLSCDISQFGRVEDVKWSSRRGKVGKGGRSAENGRRRRTVGEEGRSVCVGRVNEG